MSPSLGNGGLRVGELLDPLMGSLTGDDLYAKLLHYVRNILVHYGQVITG